MTIEKIPGRPDRAATNLYHFLFMSFPSIRNNYGALDVVELATEINRSYETVYRWLRADRITLANSNIPILVNLAKRPKNVAKLSEAGKKPPTFEDFLKYTIVH